MTYTITTKGVLKLQRSKKFGTRLNNFFDLLEKASSNKEFISGFDEKWPIFEQMMKRKIFPTDFILAFHNWVPIGVWLDVPEKAMGHVLASCGIALDESSPQYFFVIPLFKDEPLGAIRITGEAASLVAMCSTPPEFWFNKNLYSTVTPPSLQEE